MKFKPKQEHCDLFLACAMDGGIEELGQKCDWIWTECQPAVFQVHVWLLWCDPDVKCGSGLDSTGHIQAELHVFWQRELFLRKGVSEGNDKMCLDNTAVKNYYPSSRGVTASIFIYRLLCFGCPNMRCWYAWSLSFIRKINQKARLN